ncbi:ATP synthase F1 subunit delta [Lentilactobacillus sp. SPB1-3]|uniref:ATP synthase F1 subunit delta n=1 Tax=Lentilactobacillus terminaliae TaxID=3003483 RepID=A0ACD5DCF8_9LACO|nr:ATP synthase F1 subunit delta [Lentilactobacillus sp. SPB1-3]MCZ0977420.1 ATP synthase F1 subunit delta [Lentilactobacillus sp. SPB1-3]
MTDNITSAKKYAKAMLDALKDQNKLDEEYSELVEVRKIFKENPSLASILESSQTSADQKQSLLKPILENGSDFLINLFNIIDEYQRYTEVVTIIDEFGKLYNKENSIVTAEVTSAVELDNDQQSKIADAFANRIGAKKVVLNTRVDSDIIGGIVLRSEDTLIDGSVKARIEKVKELLLK